MPRPASLGPSWGFPAEGVGKRLHRLCNVLEVAKAVVAATCEQLPTAGLSAGTREPLEGEGRKLIGYNRCSAYQPRVVGFPKP